MPLHPLQEEWDADLVTRDPLSFPGYAGQLARVHGESVLTGRAVATGAGGAVHYALIEGRFDAFGGSMGVVAGERVVRAYRRATDERLPVVVATATGGARMQEGMVALVQMARTVEAARRHADAGLLSIAILGHPTTGGVYASYASLTDLRAAARGATIGFAGPRVVEQATGTPLPAGVHTAEFAYEHGLVDALVAPDEEASWVEGALGLRAVAPPFSTGSNVRTDIAVASAWGEVVGARAPDRPTGVNWAARLCSSWTDLHGTDPVVRAGLATIEATRLVVVATDRFAGDGRPRPAGYRLAQRAVSLAGRLGLPLLSLVDTPGADPGPASEADGIAGEIARTFAAMAALPTASVAVCVGEGGSGGALALAHADRLLIQEHAIFSVIAPEGAAAILHRDPSRAPEVAEQLRLTSRDLLDLGIVDGVVPESDDAMRAAVAGAFATAAAGDRGRRADAATERWLG